MRSIWVVAYLATTLHSAAQEFQGCCVYTHSVELLLPEGMGHDGMSSSEILAQMRGQDSWSDSASICYGPEGYVKLVHDRNLSHSIYLQATNTLYSHSQAWDRDIYTLIDAGADLDEEFSGDSPTISTPDSSVIINGLVCREVRVTWAGGLYRYFYAPGYLPADPAQYAHHHQDGLAQYMQIARALPVRIERRIPGLIAFTSTLLHTKEGEVPPEFFAIPELVTDPELEHSPLPQVRYMRVRN